MTPLARKGNNFEKIWPSLCHHFHGIVSKNLKDLKMKISTAGIVAALVAYPSMGAAFAPSLRTNVVRIALGVKRGSFTVFSGELVQK
jgi:hypothetical protein